MHRAPTQLDPIHDIGTWVGARVLAGVLFGIGWFLFGLAAHQARVYPDWAARILVIGAVISLLPFPGAFLVLAVGLVWVGFVVFSRKAASDQQPSRVR